MRRPLLVSLIMLGLVFSAVGGLGVFAPFSDFAKTGVNSVESGERAASADLELAIVGDVSECDDPGTIYLDNLVDAFHTVTNAQPGTVDTQAWCVRNVGSAQLPVIVTVSDRIETDFACTGDESAVDPTCGGDDLGELGSVLGLYAGLDCANPPLTSFMGLIGNDAAAGLAPLDPGQTMCGTLEVGILSTVSDTDLTKAQTDRVTWRYTFFGSTP